MRTMLKYDTLAREAVGVVGMARHKLIVIDDHPLFREALRRALSSGQNGMDVQEAGTLDEASKLLTADPQIDLVLLDLKMPGANGMSALMQLRSHHPAIPVIIVSATDEASTIRNAMELGASGYVPKSQPIEVVRIAVEAVLAGNLWTPPEIDLSVGAKTETSDLVKRLAALTPQQVKVLRMLGEGLLNKQIAFQLGVSEATIKAHVSAILQKLGVDSRTQAVIMINKIDASTLPRSDH